MCFAFTTAQYLPWECKSSAVQRDMLIHFFAGKMTGINITTTSIIDTLF